MTWSRMKCPCPISVLPSGRTEKVIVPCGRCGACRYNRRVDWSFRLKEEFKNSLCGHFLTLTYDESNLPWAGDLQSLNKVDVQLFIKRLRKANSATLRFYCVGEYGSKTGRPHYHALIFNCDRSVIDRINDIWQLGNVMVGDVTNASIHYVTKYHVNYDKSQVERAPEFALMSRRPGIGAQYVDRTRKYHQDSESAFIVNNGFKQRMPRFYKDKLFSQAQKDMFAEEAEKRERESYEKEYRRLIRLGIDDPDLYMEVASFLDAEKVQRKSKENGKL